MGRSLEPRLAPKLAARLATGARGAVLTVATLALLAGGAGFVVGPGSEEMLRRSFSTALVNDAPTATQARTASKAPISGSEDYWLSQAPHANIAPAMRKVAVGDRISLTLAGENKTYEVSTVRDAAPTLTRIDTSNDGAAQAIIITARDTGNAAAGSVRFIVEYDGPRAPSIRSIGGRAL